MNRRPPVFGVLDPRPPLELGPDPTPAQVIRAASLRIHQEGGQVNPRQPEVLLAVHGAPMCMAIADWIDSDPRARGWHRSTKICHDARVFQTLVDKLPSHRKPPK